MIIDINILHRLGKRFGIFPISKQPQLQQVLQNPQIFIKAPAGFEPIITGAGYAWDDELNGYRLGNQKLFILPNGVHVWTFKDVLARGLNSDRVEKWVSGDPEYPKGKADAFFVIYGKLTGQNLGEGETAGDDVPDGEQEPDEGGGLATAEDPDAPPFSKQDIQNMLKGEFSAAGAEPKAAKASMDTSIPTGEPPKPVDRSGVGKPLPPGAGVEKLIKKLTLGSPHMPADEIIALWKKAKAIEASGDIETYNKLMAAIKQLMPLEEGKIHKQQLEGLVQKIVEGIVDEVEEAKRKAKAKKSVSKKLSNPDDEDDWPPKEWDEEPSGRKTGPDDLGDKPNVVKKPSHSQMDWDASADSAPRGGAHGPSQEGMYKEWLIDLANRMWKDPMNIGQWGQGWEVKKVVPHGDATAYLLSLRRVKVDSRIFMHRNGKWSWLDPHSRDRTWKEIDEIPPGEEPSIEQEQSGAGAAGAGGMSVTGNVSPVTGPLKKKSVEKDKCPTCAGEKVSSVSGMNKCEAGHTWTVPFKGRKELEEMTTTSGGGGSSAGTPGYQVPGAFAGNKMSNRKGHIEVLGYKMTPEGEKEYNRSGDKLYESIKKNIQRMMAEASGLGADFDRAQRSYDAQMPPEGPKEIECPECGGAGHYTQQWKKGRYYQWEAECDQCGNHWGDDNLDDDRGGR